MLEDAVAKYKSEMTDFNTAHAKLRHNKAIIKVSYPIASIPTYPHTRQ